ncbi:MAG: tRNA (adenosine(37)-N6)-threonylcarbamoyltransferase complex dimerization subunit type 1 TsaB, partial [Povalibacter sp.]
EVLLEARITLRQLDGIAYGRGPGAFTGVRIAVGVVQGLAFGAALPTVGVSNLAAVAQQVAQPGARVLVCMDARMQEIYWGMFEADGEHVVALGSEHVSKPDMIGMFDKSPTVAAGTGFAAYPILNERFSNIPIQSQVLPRASDIAVLGEWELARGLGRSATDAQPVYLRDNVAVAKKS